MKRDVPEIMVSISVHVSNIKEHELLPIRLAQAADAQPQQPQRPRNQFVPAEEEATQSVNIRHLGDRFLD
jgi:hypothetical protein